MNNNRQEILNIKKKGKKFMKQVVFNKEGLTDDEIEMREQRVKVVLRNSNDELLLCKVDGVYHFVGGHPEGEESINNCAKREVKEETGIDMESESFTPFLELKQYKSDYFGTGKNGLATITYIDGKTDERFNYGKRDLDEKESEKEFVLEYVKIDDVMRVLETNKEVSKIQNKEFITTEMMYVVSEYKKQLKKLSEKKDNREEMEK